MAVPKTISDEIAGLETAMTALETAARTVITRLATVPTEAEVAGIAASIRAVKVRVATLTDGLSGSPAPTNIP